MPRYDFVCDDCKVIKEHKSSIKDYDEINAKCPECGNSMSRIYDSPRIRFIGKGFYSTDYPKKVDRKGMKSLANEYDDMIKYGESQIEEDEEEDTQGFLVTDRHGKKQFVHDDDVDEVITEGSKTRLKLRKGYKRL